jgi:hypothetical protein
MEETTQTMDTTPPPADTQETSEHDTAKCENSASSGSFSHQKKYTKSHVKSQRKITTPKFTSENPFSILQTEHDAQTNATSETSITRQGRNKIPPNCHYIKN